jgi:hypothetical protein
MKRSHDEVAPDQDNADETVHWLFIRNEEQADDVSALRFVTMTGQRSAVKAAVELLVEQFEFAEEGDAIDAILQSLIYTTPKPGDFFSPFAEFEGVYMLLLKTRATLIELLGERCCSKVSFSSSGRLAHFGAPVIGVSYYDRLLDDPPLSV